MSKKLLHPLSLGFLILLIFLMGSCYKNPILSHSFFYELGEEGLSQNQEYVFFPFEQMDKDTLGLKYDFFLIIRFSDRYKLKYLPLEIESSDLNCDTIIKEVINLNLFDNDNQLIGKGNFGIFERKILLKKKQLFDESAFVAISTKEKATEGILSLGLLTLPSN